MATFSDMFTKRGTANPLKQETPFEALIDDILIYLSAFFLTSRDLWALTLVSRRCNAIAMPFLYSNVRLTVDQNGTSILPRKKNYIDSQRRFHSTLTAHPDRKWYAQTLGWYIDTPESYSLFAELIAHMENIQHIHVTSPYQSPLPVETPSKLLPVCTSVFLQGVISPQFAKPMINPLQLKVLALDSIPQFAIPILEWIAHDSFPNLTRISLRFPSGPELTDTMEILLLKAWRAVLASLRCILESVTLGARVQNRRGLVGYLIPHPLQWHFSEYLLPIFSEKEFPRLQTLTFEGMKGGNSQYSLDSDSIAEIRETIVSAVVTFQPNPWDTLWYDYLSQEASRVKAVRRAWLSSGHVWAGQHW
ncbi:hypothetical protein K439DRAFT_1635542 [Ramaria rubella]|nr:hypothetical protein K439DRAFT_1635542 [Ramaria rubella]